MTAEEKRNALGRIKALVTQGRPGDAVEHLRRLADPGDDYVLQNQYAALARRIPPAECGLHPLSVAMLGSGTLDHFVPILSFWALLEGFSLEASLAPFNTARQQILDPGSPLYAGNPDVIWIFSHARDFAAPVPLNADPAAVDEAVEAAVAEHARLWETVRRHSSAYILQNNADLPAERDLGNYEGTVPWSRTTFLRQLNVAFARRCPPGVGIFDFDHASACFGKSRWFTPRYWYHSRHCFSFDAYGLVAFKAVRVFGALKGRAKKCLVLDLDNTLWGGVIGDDGLDGIRIGSGPDGEAFADFQAGLKRLRERGILLAVCSKNERENAVEPFEKHPDMRLRLADFAAFKADWRDKVVNIREIAEQLNIGLDAIVFLDDNPAERELVRSRLPAVTVPELPEDPAEYGTFLDGLHLFEMTAFSEEDQDRTRMYQENSRRSEARNRCTDLADYLRDLRMVATVGRPDAFHRPRMVQLINKSNQFHLTTTRYTEAQFQDLAGRDDHLIRYFKLSDRFGDNGLIAVIILRREGAELVVDTWVMSCRVLSRGMEEFIADEMVRLAGSVGAAAIRGRYIPTKKNRLVADLYRRLGFTETGRTADGTSDWRLELATWRPARPAFIERTESA